MRIITGLTVLFMSVSVAALAAAPAPIEQKTPPVAPNAAAPNKDFTPVLPSTAQPNSLKVIPDSGGVSTSYLVKDAPVSGDYVMGDTNAPLTMVEYASMTCPHCAHFSGVVMPEIEKKYVRTGKIKYILRQFPLNEPALKAAMLLECVGSQSREKYYVFAKVMFDAQSKWAFDGNYLAGLETIAMVGGLSRGQFQNCVNNTDREMYVLRQKKLATEELQLPHTPYIFIGGEIFSGDHTAEAVSRFIDAKLAQLSQKQ